MYDVGFTHHFTPFCTTLVLLPSDNAHRAILLTDDSARFLRRIDTVTTDKVRGKTRTSFAYSTDIVRRK